jgi:LPS sulfotransferase NodH
MRAAYIIASTFRCGSSHLAVSLWRTGRLGAPFEYLNYENEMRVLYYRLRAESPQDYLQKLIERRTTVNGIFGIKVHFHHFQAALVQNAHLLESLRPLHFVYINRQDELAQAVSLAKAFQTRAWVSLIRPARVRLFYNREFIDACREEIRAQKADWERWFSEAGVSPLRVDYEELLGQQETIVGRVLDLLGARADVPTKISVPQVDKQADATNREWTDRYRAESVAG